MFGRTPKPPVKQVRTRPTNIDASGRSSPTFSYYANRQPSERSIASPRRTNMAERNSGQTRPGFAVRRPRFVISRLPYYLLAAVIILCTVKVLYLNTDPKLIVLGKSASSMAYLQSVDTYTQYAHDQLSHSVLNRFKPTANVSGTTAALERQFPELSSVSLGIPFIGSRPIVYAEVAQPSVVLQAGQNNYALNKDGLVLAKLASVPANIPLLVDQSGVSLQIGRQLLPSSAVSFINGVYTELTAGHIAPGIFVLPQTNPFELDEHLEGRGYIIKFNLQGNVLLQSGTAVATINQLAGKQPANYIDVRVPNRVYYK